MGDAPLPREDVWRQEGAVPASRLALALRPLLACLEEACRHPAGHAAMAGTAGRLSRLEFIGIVRRVAAAVQRRVPAGARVAASASPLGSAPSTATTDGRARYGAEVGVR